MSTISLSSSSVSVPGDSITIFIRCDKLLSLKQLRKRVCISFICEKLLSTEAVAMGIERVTVASVLKLGNMVFSMSLEANSPNCTFMSSLGCLAMNWRNVFHSVQMSEEISASLHPVMSLLICVHHSGQGMCEWNLLHKRTNLIVHVAFSLDQRYSMQNDLKDFLLGV